MIRLVADTQDQASRHSLLYLKEYDRDGGCRSIFDLTRGPFMSRYSGALCFRLEPS